MPLDEMPLSSGNFLEHRIGTPVWQMSCPLPGVMRLVRALDKGCTTRRRVCAVRWQAHDQNSGLFTGTLPQTMRGTGEGLSLCFKAAPQLRQWLSLNSHPCTCFEMNSACT
jgi:hypothetical protein